MNGPRTAATATTDGERLTRGRLSYVTTKRWSKDEDFKCHEKKKWPRCLC